MFADRQQQIDDVAAPVELDARTGRISVGLARECVEGVALSQSARSSAPSPLHQVMFRLRLGQLFQHGPRLPSRHDVALLFVEAKRFFDYRSGFMGQPGKAQHLGEIYESVAVRV
jgi:hypothetical protein